MVIIADSHRLRGTVARIVRGLYRHFVGRRLPLEHEVRVIDCEDPPTGLVLEWRNRVMAPLSAIEHRIGDVFECQYKLTDGDEEFSLWRMVFYGVSEYLAITGPPQDCVADGGLRRS